VPEGLKFGAGRSVAETVEVWGWRRCQSEGEEQLRGAVAWGREPGAGRAGFGLPSYSSSAQCVSKRAQLKINLFLCECPRFEMRQHRHCECWVDLGFLFKPAPTGIDGCLGQFVGAGTPLLQCHPCLESA
jgi:hypothetical protein